MAQIDKPNLHFNTVLYTGNGSTQSITGVGFQPDWLWIKERSDGSSHAVMDAVRGNNKKIMPNTNDAESTETQYITSFNSDGFSIGQNNGINQSGQTNVAWNWKANGQGSSNTDGSINTTYTSANTTAGFSIVKYTGNQTNGATVGHGLGAVPKMIIIKNLNDAEHWTVYHDKLSTGHQLYLNISNAQNDDASEYYDTTPTSSVFTLGNSDRTNNVNIPYIAYCFAEKKGFSKFGSYTGNGNADGAFVYTGFKPAFVIIKCFSESQDWVMFDNKRDPHNVVAEYLRPNQANAASSGTNYMDFTSNGIKHRVNDTWTNGNNKNYIYMAFAENPIVGSNNIPATAK